MASVEDLYQEIILEHNKHPRNLGPLEDATNLAEGHNPLCGDELEVQLVVTDDRVKRVCFQAQGCAISRASASMMTELVEGKPLSECVELAEQVVAKLKGEAAAAPEAFGNDLDALLGVRKFPARIKCATLAWHALLAALQGGGVVSSEKGD